MKIAVIGLGYVGVANAVLLAKNNTVVGVDIDKEKVNKINKKISPVVDAELSVFLKTEKLSLNASTDLKTTVTWAEVVIIATPTNYNESTNSFDTSSVESVIQNIKTNNPKALIIIKSTVPVGFTEEKTITYNTNQLIFSPEFLREGHALSDSLYPSRIVVGEQSNRAQMIANLFVKGAIKKNIQVLLTNPQEAESIKLFSNTYLAMRVAFFNEVDSFALSNNLNPKQLIDGIGMDSRIGTHYNNPSFGYGGYCLPKDTKQLLSNYKSIPQSLIQAIVDSNATRKKYISDTILLSQPKTVGIYRLIMKSGSDNFRSSSINDIISYLQKKGVHVIIYEPLLPVAKHKDIKVIKNLNEFKILSEIIIANRPSDELSDCADKIFTRDIYNVS